MARIETRYLASDRLFSLRNQTPLPSLASGSVLFADIAGFTALTDTFTRRLGARRGAERLTGHLNAVYNALIAEVERYGGSVISFSGDAMTCWFPGERSARTATNVAFALLDALQPLKQVAVADGETASLDLKVAIASGPTRRFVVGDPSIQRLDTLAGATVARMASGEKAANPGEVVADRRTVEILGDALEVREWRHEADDDFAVLERPRFDVEPVPPLVAEPSALGDEQLRAWLLPPVAQQLEAGLGEFLTELRPVVTLFLRFAGIDYDRDSDAERKLDHLVRQVQSMITGSEGHVVSLTIGDKGSYLQCVFGAPTGHEDDAIRALKTAFDLRDAVTALGYLEPAQIGISQGIMRTGAYGSETRRTYGVFGDETNLAARLMSAAPPGTILVTEAVRRASAHHFVFQTMEPLSVKGKTEAVPVHALIGLAEPRFEERFYTTPLTGREAELAALQWHLQPILDGRHAGVIVVHGPPGMGKSRLVYETRRRFQAGKPIVWLTGQADERVRAPLYAIGRALRAYLGQDYESPPAVNAQRFEEAFGALLAQSGETSLQAALLRGRDLLAQLVGLHSDDRSGEAIDEKARLENMIAAVKTCIRAVATSQPVIMLLEDGQWLDGSSLRVVQALTYAMQDVGLALLLTIRDADDGQPFTLEEVYDVPITTLGLSRLSDDALRIVAEAVLGGPVTEMLAHYVRAKAEGTPFFAEQILLDLRESQAVVETPDGWDLRYEVVGQVPAGVNTVLLARLDRLPTDVKAVVQQGAILGREVDGAVLGRMRYRDAESHLQAAAEAGIWTRMAGMRYVFRHALLRDAAYVMQPETRRRDLHRLAAEAIEALYPGDPVQDDALLEHWHQANDKSAELAYLAKVAQRLVDVEGHYAAAERLLKRSLEGLGENDARRVPVLNWLSKAAWRQGLYLEAAEAAEAARVLTTAVDDRAGLARALHNLGVVTERQGRYEEAQAYLEQSRAVDEALGNQTGVAANLNSLGIVATAQGAHERARGYLEASLAIRRALGDRAGMSASLTNLGVVTWNQSAYDEARNYMEQSLALDRELQDRAGIATSLSNLAAIVKQQGDYDRAKAYNEESLALFRDLGDRDGIAFCLDNLGSLLAGEGSYDQARTYLEQSLQVSRELGDPVRIASSLEHLGEVSYRQGRYVEAAGAHRQALDIRRDINSTDLPSSLNWLTRTLIGLGDKAQARNLLREIVAGVGTQDVGLKLAALLTGAELYLVEGHPQEAARIAWLVAHHPTVRPEQRQDAQRVLAACQSQLDPQVLGSVTAESRMDIEAVIMALRQELS